MNIILEHHQQRVIEERKQLEEKIDRLTGFLESVNVREVTPQERDRMDRQLTIMRQYSEVLKERIENFSK